MREVCFFSIALCPVTERVAWRLQAGYNLGYLPDLAMYSLVGGWVMSEDRRRQGVGSRAQIPAPIACYTLQPR
jgi:hypothetical protein